MFTNIYTFAPQFAHSTLHSYHADQLTINHGSEQR